MHTRNTNMKEILEITNQTSAQRNDLLLEAFFFWAGKNTETKPQYQIVLISKPIRTWFFLEYEKLEREFLHFVKRHSNATANDNGRLYARMTGKIYDIYPKVLLEDIKKKYSEIPIRNLN